MDTRVAIPTEYKGVKYRSKSEAMFARYLELTEHKFVYEPEDLEVDGWVPDFHAMDIRISPDRNKFRLISSHWIIEYKPAYPTESYIETFRMRCDRLWDRFPDSTGRSTCLVEMDIAYGSVWNRERGFISYVPGERCKGESQTYTYEHDWLCGIEKQIMNTRFDLR